MFELLISIVLLLIVGVIFFKMLFDLVREKIAFEKAYRKYRKEKESEEKFNRIMKLTKLK